MQKIVSEMAGSVLEVKVKVGDKVEKGDEILIVESMKMEIPVVTEVAGKIKTIKFQEGDFINEGDIIAEVE